MRTQDQKDLNAASRKIRVLIAEDQRLVRQCFQEVLELEDAIEVVGGASDGEEAVVLAERQRPDIVLMDMSMPNLDGVSAAALIHERVPTTKVLMLSLHDTPVHIVKALKAGVSGYILKTVDLQELVRIIKAVSRGERIHSPFLADQRLHEAKELEDYGLTLREVQVLKLLVQGDNNSEIAQKLYVSEQTIKKELASLFEKLAVKNRTQAAVKAVQIGLVDSKSVA